MVGLLPHSLTAALYALLGYVFWRFHWRAPAGPARALPAARLALLVPLALHAWLLYAHAWRDGQLDLGVGIVLSAIAWLALVVYGLNSLRHPVDALNVLVLPAAAVIVLLPLALPARPLPLSTDPVFLAHLALAFFAYALFTIAAVHAGVMALLDKRLHRHTMAGPLAHLPPLLTMEQLLFRIIGSGFVLLTLALVSGMLFSEQVFGKPFSFQHFTQHKTVFALISWCTYAALLAGRRLYGWRGRTAVVLSLVGFGMLLLAYVGSKIVLELLLHR